MSSGDIPEYALMETPSFTAPLGQVRTEEPIPAQSTKKKKNANLKSRENSQKTKSTKWQRSLPKIMTNDLTNF